MNLTPTWIESSWMKALGWTFVHSIWQIAIIGLLLFIVLRCIPRRSAHTRYTVSTLALWTTLMAALSTFIIMLPEQKGIMEVSGNIVLVAATKTTSLAGQVSVWLESRMPMMLTIWFGGVAILMLRLVISLGWISHLRYDSFPEEQLQSTLNQIIHRLRLNVRPMTSESFHIKSPLTLGHVKPLILFPIGIVNQLSPKEVEAILTHELAHIVRKDYLSNLIQSFIETLFYYHPVTWWISRMVRTERENRADDLAVSWCGDHLGYAKALVTIEEMQVQHVPNLTMGFASRKRAMLARIQRILNLPYKNHNQMEKTVLLSLCSLCFLAFTLTSQAHENRQKGTLPEPAALTIPHHSDTDSIPASGSYKIHKKTDTQDISIEVQDGDVKELKIDGKDIARSDFNQYDKVIDDLFGSLESRPTREGMMGLASPGVPPMPPMEGFHFMMPSMSDLARLEDLQLQQKLELKELNKLLGENGGYTMIIGDPELKAKGLRIYHDTTSTNGKYEFNYKFFDGDSVICMPGYGWAKSWSGDYPAAIDLDGQLLDEEELQKWAEEYQRQADAWGKEWGKTWQKQAEKWAEQSDQWREQEQFQQEHQRREQDLFRRDQERQRNEERRMHEKDRNPSWIWNEDRLAQEEAEQAIAHELRRGGVYVLPSPRLSLSDEMVRDGLIQPGQEVEVQLTPDKLKINGHKQSEELHEKYLRIYERQQGIELSGNSRVEFRTKSKQRM